MRNLLRQSSLGIIVMCISLLSGCSSERVDLIDLNKVLDIFTSTMDQFSDVGVEGYNATKPNDSPETSGQQQAQLNKFVSQYEINLNQEELMSHRIGVDLLKDGSMEGYADRDNSSSKGDSEEKLFTIEIDAERNRLIATDTQNGYQRDGSLAASLVGGMVGGMLAGYLLSSMMSRQKASGVRSSRFSNMKMSSQNYHKSAAQAKTRSSSSSSARSRSGSGSYSSGK